MSETDRFLHYAVDRLGMTPFRPDFDAPAEMAFAASLSSFEALHRASWGAANANGQTLVVEAGYLESMVPNAFADLHGDHHFIGMHQALLVTIMDLVLFAFTQRALFPSIGDAADEDSPAPMNGGVPGLYLLELTLGGGTVDADRARHRIPKDADRHIMAVYLAMLMTRFVWEHELAHCELGHVQFLKAEGHGAYLTEAPFGTELVAQRPSRVSSAELSAIRHAFELEADAVALRRCIAVQIQNMENIPGIAALDPGLRIQMTLFGSYLMTWLFEAYGRHAAIKGGASHPEPMMRLACLQAETAAVLGGLDGFEAFHAGVLRQLETLLDALGVATALRPALFAPVPQRLDTEPLLAPYRFG